MLEPKYLDALPESLIELYRQVEQDILTDMARRLVEYDYWIPAVEHQRQKLREMGLSQEHIIRILSRMSGKSQGEIKRLMQQACDKALESDRDYYRQHGFDAPSAKSAEMKAILNAGLKSTNQLFRNLTRTTASAGQVQFVNALDRAWLQINSGAFDYNTAIRNAVKDIARQGLQAIRYPSGRTDTLGVAVRRAVVTGVNQTAAQMQLQLASEVGSDLVETTAHAGARPDHVEWQGQVFSLSGKHPKYPDFRQSTGYGTGAGLCGWNCRHSFNPYVEGSSRAYSEDLLEEYNTKKYTYNGKQLTEYEASQVQRYHERQIRRWKRENAAMQAAGLDTYESAARIHSWQERQKDFLRQTGLKRQSEREQIAGFGKSEASKAKSIVAKYDRIRYHKDGTIVITDDWKSKGKVSIPKQYRPNAVVEIQTEFKNGTVQIDRTLYDQKGAMVKQVHSGSHNRPDKHPFGNNGEHAHDYKWSDDGKLLSRNPRELSSVERKEHADIL